MSIPVLENYDIQSVSCAHANKPGWHFNPKRAVLLIHDMQDYFVNFYGADSRTVKYLLLNIVKLKQACKRMGVPCIYTAQPGNQKPEERALLTDFWGEGLADDPSLTNIVSILKPDASDTVLTKWRYSAFKKNHFNDWLQQQQQERDQILICGVYAHIGILATALEAFMLDYQAFVVSDAVADFSVRDHEQALDYVAKRCGVVCDVQSILHKSAHTHTHTHTYTSTSTSTDNIAEREKKAAMSKKRILADIAHILMLDEAVLKPDDNLQYLGLDSMRLMALIERWQNDGARVDFAELAENMTLGHWYPLLLSGTAKASFVDKVDDVVKTSADEAKAIELAQ